MNYVNEINIYSKKSIDKDSNIYKLIQFYYLFLDDCYITVLEDLINQYLDQGNIIKYTDSDNPLLLAIKKNDIRLVKFLLNKTTTIDPNIYYIATAIYNTSIDCLKIFLEDSRFKFNILYKYGLNKLEVTLVTYAMKNNIAEEFVLQILDRYIKDNGNIFYYNIITNNNMLHDAYYLNYNGVVTKLLEYDNTNILKDKLNNQNKYPGDYCIIDCASVPTNINTKKNFIFDNINDMFILKSFPNINISDFNINIFKHATLNNVSIGAGGFGNIYI